MALMDLAGQMAGLPIIDFIGGAARLGVRPMWHLGNKTTEADIAEARAMQARGVASFKLKIGSKGIEEDIEATLALRQALGSQALLCADANAGLTLDAARRYVEATRRAELRFLEQPLDPADLGGLGNLARMSPVAIGVDEGIHALGDIETQSRAGASGVSLKLIKLGGIASALEAAQLAARLGLGINVAAKIAESSIATAAALHLACAIPRIDWGVSLTHFYLAEDIVHNPPHLHDGEVALPLGAGLGVDIDEAAVARFRAK
jgi:muconate cycloisomerase